MRSLFQIALLSVVLSACGDDSTPRDTGPTGDAGADAPVLSSARVATQRSVVIVEGSSEVFEIEVPENVLSVGLSLQRSGDQGFSGLTVCEWLDSTGEVVVSPSWRDYAPVGVCQPLCASEEPDCDPRGTCINPVFSDFGATAAAVFPSGAAVTPSAGVHRVRVCATPQEILAGEPFSGPIDVSVSIRTGRVPTAGFLDLNLYFTGSRGWTAESSAADPDFESMLDEMFEIYAAIGLERGRITRTDIPSPGVVETESNDFDFVRGLPDAPFGISVIFVEGFDVEGVLGSAKIPGTFEDGASRDAVLVVANEDTDLSTLDTVVAHELGHFFGLPHTNQQALGFNFQDAFDDTVSGDERLLMFAANAGGTYISPQQSVVILRSPHVRGPDEVLP